MLGSCLIPTILVQATLRNREVVACPVFTSILHHEKMSQFSHRTRATKILGIGIIEEGDAAVASALHERDPKLSQASFDVRHRIRVAHRSPGTDVLICSRSFHTNAIVAGTTRV